MAELLLLLRAPIMTKTKLDFQASGWKKNNSNENSVFLMEIWNIKQSTEEHYWLLSQVSYRTADKNVVLIEKKK